ncbi:hypothetical protein [Porticoccus sp.]|uniref:hypothetical protein n=1 Tax=Porticoccus sp. TaxID=2024853 RepID=UPI003F6A0214
MKLIPQILALVALTSLQVHADTNNEPASQESSKEAQINWQSPEEISTLIEYKMDPVNGEITYGPNFALSEKNLSDNFSEIYLVRAVDLEGEDQYVLYITAQYNDEGWRSYTKAKTKDGEMRLVPMSKDEYVCKAANCRYEERVALPLSFIRFFDSANMGMDLTISGNRTYEIKLPSSYFKAILNAAPEEEVYENLPEGQKI